MVEPGSAVPLSGVPPDTMLVTVGASGASVSTITLTGALLLVLPAASAACAVTVCVVLLSTVPSGRVSVHCPWPLACTTP
ncbi:hypothetical protein D3C78_1750550 [compost metagenome]